MEFYTGARSGARGLAVVWLWAVLLIILAMVMVGGATRLTGSGLSITEWKPITGILPPMSDAGWSQEFAKYQKIPQYSAENYSMTLDEYKNIYWWEWAHRNLGRAASLLLLPLLILIACGQVRGWMAVRWCCIFVLGGLQAVAGWYMVSSGLADRVDVSHIRLAIHLSIAMLMFGLVSFEIGLAKKPRRVNVTDLDTPALIFSICLVAAVVGQLMLGALVAGLDGGYYGSDWPLINGYVVPPNLGMVINRPWDALHDPVILQFLHRVFGYLIFLIALFLFLRWWCVDRCSPQFKRGVVIIALILAQIMLGVCILWYSVPVSVAVLHQLNGFIILFMAVTGIADLYRVRRSVLISGPDMID